MTKPSEPREAFLRWVVKNGGSRRTGRGRYEFARFEACDMLCIVYQGGDGRVSRFSPREMCGQIWKAFVAGSAIDLTNTIDADPLNHYRVLARLLGPMLAVKRGEVAGFDTIDQAAANRCTADQLTRMGLANGLVLDGHTLVRPPGDAA